MSKRQVQITILCEDYAHDSFVRAYLTSCGYDRGKLRVLRYPNCGKGSGKQFVRNGYLTQVRTIRRYCRMNQSNTYALIVVIDHDTDTQPNPHKDLDQKLTEADFDRRQPDEHIAIFSPKRNIETWVYHLLDSARRVDETTDYKNNIDLRECHQAGTLFHNYDPGDACPLPSLKIGREERQRIP